MFYTKNFSSKKIALSALILCVSIMQGYTKNRNTSPRKKNIQKKSIPNQPPILQANPLYWDWKSIDTNDIQFPSDFLWGVSASAHQTEGNCTNNDWATWEMQHAKQKTGSACDHWNRYKQDIQLMKKSGITSFRFSIEWSKVEPQPGVFDETVLTHYQSVCKELKNNNIKPVITLHHYTNPKWFAAKGGFEKKENIPHYIHFAKKVFEKLSPYAYMWITFNSPTSYAARAYYKQMAPPGKNNMQLMVEVIKNMLEAHVQAYQTLKRINNKASIGICHNIFQVEPSSSWDKTACSYADHLFGQTVYQFFNTGVFKASVPFKVRLNHKNKYAPQSLDFIGLNYYSHGLMKNFDVVRYPKEIPMDVDLFTIYPEGLYRAIKEVNDNLAAPLHIPIYVTENGIATHNEKHREQFFKQTLYALSQAIAQGYPVKGYFVWSLTDNYEWGSYNTCYGIYAVDFNTQERATKPRAGAQHLINVIKKQ